MLKLITFLAAVTVSTIAVAPPTVQAQDSATSPASKQRLYLFDTVPIEIDGEKSSERLLTNHWRPDKCMLDGVEYKHSVSFGSSYNESSVSFDVHGYDFFEANVGVIKRPNMDFKVRYIVLGDENKRLLTTPTQTQDTSGFHILVPIKGTQKLTLKVVQSGPNNNQIWWGDACLIKGQAQKEPMPSSSEPKPQDPIPVTQSNGETFTFEIHDIEDLARKLKEQVDEDKEQFKTKPVQVAVASFELFPKTLSPDNANKVREQLGTALIKTKTFRVIERAQIDKILDELKRSKSDLTDSATALKIGKLTNARAVLVGSISDEKTYIIVNVRMINTETGESTIAESVEVKKR